jgi:hypothetical protein
MKICHRIILRERNSAKKKHRKTKHKFYVKEIFSENRAVMRQFKKYNFGYTVTLRLLTVWNNVVEPGVSKFTT